MPGDAPLDRFFERQPWPPAEELALDVLINNAGIAIYDDLSNLDVIERHLAVKILGVLRMTHAFLPLLRRSKGAIVNNLSLVGLAALPVTGEGKGPYAGPRRPGSRTPTHAVDGRREGVRIRGAPGKVSLLDLFERRRQLIVYRAFFEPGVFGWPEHACRGCSFLADQVVHLAHLNARDTTLAFASRAPQADIERLKARTGWQMPWYTITDSFDTDFGVNEWHGTNAFIQDGEREFRTYFINNRGDEAMGSTWSYLDITALGRQEKWEDSPAGYPQTPPYKWWNWHDNYNAEASPDPKWVEVSDAGEAAFRKRDAEAKQ